MSEFPYPDSYRRFEETVKLKTRYVFDGEVQAFLAAVAESSETRKDTIDKASVLWRAQRGYIWRKENPGTEQEFEVPDGFEPGRMVPQPEFVGDGRVNPRGIP